MRNHARGPILLMRVDSYVARLLEGRVRKGPVPRPLIEHMREVRELLKLADADDETQAAGLLHDVPELTRDIPELTPVTIERISHLFGERVGGFVGGVTDPPEFKFLPTEEKKCLQADRMRTACTEIKMIRQGDIISNLRELENNPPVGWDTKKIHHYIHGDLLVAHACSEASRVLDQIFQEVYERVCEKYLVSQTRA